MILAIDPGTHKSGWVLYNSNDLKKPVLKHAVTDNVFLVEAMRARAFPKHISYIVIEQFGAMGMPIGRACIETIQWTGQLQVYCRTLLLRDPTMILRKDVKMHLCASTRARDSNVWQAVMDRYGSSREVAVGKKKTPGPLYGITSHERAALALAITFAETH